MLYFFEIHVLFQLCVNPLFPQAEFLPGLVIISFSESTVGLAVDGGVILLSALQRYERSTMLCEFLYFLQLVVLWGVGAIIPGLYLFVGLAHLLLFACVAVPEHYCLFQFNFAGSYLLGKVYNLLVDIFQQTILFCQFLGLPLVLIILFLVAEFVDFAQTHKFNLGLFEFLQQQFVILLRHKFLLFAQLLTFVYLLVQFLNTGLLLLYLCHQLGQLLLFLNCCCLLLLYEHLSLKHLFLQFLQLHIALLHIFDEGFGQLTVQIMDLFLQLIMLFGGCLNFLLEFDVVIGLQHGLISFILVLQIFHKPLIALFLLYHTLILIHQLILFIQHFADYFIESSQLFFEFYRLLLEVVKRFIVVEQMGLECWMEGQIGIVPAILFLCKVGILGMRGFELVSFVMLLVMDEGLGQCDGVRMWDLLKFWKFRDGSQGGVQVGIGVIGYFVECGSLIVFLSCFVFKLHNNYISFQSYNSKVSAHRIRLWLSLEQGQQDDLSVYFHMLRVLVMKQNRRLYWFDEQRVIIQF